MLTFFSRRDGERTTGRAANLADRHPHLSDALGGYDTTRIPARRVASEVTPLATFGPNRMTDYFDDKLVAAGLPRSIATS